MELGTVAKLLLNLAVKICFLLFHSVLDYDASNIVLYNIAPPHYCTCDVVLRGLGIPPLNHVFYLFCLWALL